MTVLKFVFFSRKIVQNLSLLCKYFAMIDDKVYKILKLILRFSCYLVSTAFCHS